MAENIETSTALVKADVSTAVLSDAEFADRLEAIARDIEIFERTRRKSTFRIAKLVSEAHDLFKYRRNEGGFAGWMQTRFGCSRATAYRILAVHKKFGADESVSTWNTLSDSALFLLAPPSVPQEALDEVAARIEAGEKLSCAAVSETIARQKVADSAEKAETTNAEN